MRTSNEADIPLSGALVLQGTLSANFFPSILRAHDQIRTPREIERGSYHRVERIVFDLAQG